MKSEKSISNFILNKTWKREVSIVMFIFLGYVSLTQPIELVQILVWPIFSFGGLAFGLDWKGKYDTVVAKQSNTEVRIG